MSAVTANPRTADQNRKLWWLAGQLGLDKEAMGDIVLEFTGGRTCHTSELSFMECREITEFMQSTLIQPGSREKSSERTDRKVEGHPDRVELDCKRKGVIRAIFRWLELTGVKASMEYVKAIACRAAKRDRFNELSLGDLTRVYAEFCRKQEAVEAKAEVLNELAVSN